MNIKQKLGRTTITIVPLIVGSLFLSGGIFRSPCTANNRGVGEVSIASKTNDSVLLYWSAPDYQYTGVDVCYKKSWSLSGKCQDDDRIVSVPYGSYVNNGNVSIPGLSSNDCYKFAVYGTNPGPEVPRQLIGEVKTKTRK